MTKSESVIDEQTEFRCMYRQGAQ